VRQYHKPGTVVIEEFNALKNPERCETLSMQIVTDFVKITFYRKESENSKTR
jgi:hypothetical protein